MSKGHSRGSRPRSERATTSVVLLSPPWVQVRSNDANCPGKRGAAPAVALPTRGVRTRASMARNAFPGEIASFLSAFPQSPIFTKPPQSSGAFETGQLHRLDRFLSRVFRDAQREITPNLLMRHLAAWRPKKFVFGRKEKFRAARRACVPAGARRFEKRQKMVRGKWKGVHIRSRKRAVCGRESLPEFPGGAKKLAERGKRALGRTHNECRSVWLSFYACQAKSTALRGGIAFRLRRVDPSRKPRCRLGTRLRTKAAS